MVSFEQTGLYQFEKTGGNWEITIADLTQKLAAMKLLFNDKAYRYKMPSGLYKGKAIHIEL